MTKNQFHCPAINLEKLCTLPQSVGSASAVPVIDTLKAGFGKVLGKGLMPSKPVIVKARFFSKMAEEKIRAAGGACVLVA